MRRILPSCLLFYWKAFFARRAGGLAMQRQVGGEPAALGTIGSLAAPGAQLRAANDNHRISAATALLVQLATLDSGREANP